MAKPILVVYLRINPTKEESNNIAEHFNKIIPSTDYHKIILYGCEVDKIELLTKGRKTKTVKNLYKWLSQ